jgi:hypothetical protein
MKGKNKMKKYYVVVNNGIMVAVNANSKASAENMCLNKYWVKTALAIDVENEAKLIVNEYNDLDVIVYEDFERIEK